MVSPDKSVRSKTTAATPLSQAVGPLTGASNLPLYQQLQRALREAIDRGLLGTDDALPPERDLAIEFGVSRITVRKAIDGLVSELDGRGAARVLLGLLSTRLDLGDLQPVLEGRDRPSLQSSHRRPVAPVPRRAR